MLLIMVLDIHVRKIMLIVIESKGHESCLLNKHVRFQPVFLLHILCKLMLKCFITTFFKSMIAKRRWKNYCVFLFFIFINNLPNVIDNIIWKYQSRSQETHVSWRYRCHCNLTFPIVWKLWWKTFKLPHMYGISNWNIFFHMN